MLMVNHLIGFGAGGSVVTPDQIGATLWGWWTPDSINQSGGNLTSWTDLSGNSNTLTPQGANPGIVTGASGFTGVQLNTRTVSASERLESATTGAALDNGHLFAVLRMDEYVNNAMVAYGDVTGSTGGRGWIREDPNATADRLSALTDTARADWGSTFDPAIGSWGLVESFLEEGVAVGINVNDGTAVTTAQGTVGSSGLRNGLSLGAAGDGNDRIDCSFTELFLFTTRLTTPQRTLVIEYLKSTYGAIGTW